MCQSYRDDKPTVSYHTGKEKDALLVVLKISGILE
jgi:hypothetical protein